MTPTRKQTSIKEDSMASIKLYEFLLLIIFCSVSYSQGALPQFSWDTLPVFFHSANFSGFYSKESLKAIAKFQMVTIEKGMGLYVQNVDDEDYMVLTMKAIKDINPNVATYFYMNSFNDIQAMARMYREFKEHPEYLLHNDQGQVVTTNRGLFIYDLSNPKVRKWWQDFCLNATNFANGDGCYCDSSWNIGGQGFRNRPSPEKMKAWGDGLLTMTRDVQNALGDDKLLIGKRSNQSYVKAVQLEQFHADNDSIADLMEGNRNGKVMQAHVPINVSCEGDLTDYMAAFLIGAGEQNYFGCGNWRSEGNDTSTFIWHPEYDKPLRKPTAPATYQHDSGLWTRKFELGTKVTFDANTNKGTIEWGKKKNKD